MHSTKCVRAGREALPVLCWGCETNRSLSLIFHSIFSTSNESRVMSRCSVSSVSMLEEQIQVCCVQKGGGACLRPRSPGKSWVPLAFQNGSRILRFRWRRRHENCSLAFYWYFYVNANWGRVRPTEFKHWRRSAVWLLWCVGLSGNGWRGDFSWEYSLETR